MTLKDSHVLVAGGSSGIGLAIAKRCAAEGARVSLVSRVVMISSGAGLIGSLATRPTRRASSP